MQAYMKSSMPYLGVAAEPQQRLYRLLFGASHMTRQAWLDAILTLWREATHRGERYAAIALSGHSRYRVHQAPDLVPAYEEMIVTGAWWDYVDAIAVHRLGPLLLAHPATMCPLLVAWSRSDNLWRRRSAIISQVDARKRLHWDLLVSCIEPNIADRDFFIRKAIGWALRQHARVDPEQVRFVVHANRERLSGLSRREATRHLRPSDSGIVETLRRV